MALAGAILARVAVPDAAVYFAVISIMGLLTGFIAGPLTLSLVNRTRTGQPLASGIRIRLGVAVVSAAATAAVVAPVYGAAVAGAAAVAVTLEAANPQLPLMVAGNLGLLSRLEAIRPLMLLVVVAALGPMLSAVQLVLLGAGISVIVFGASAWVTSRAAPGIRAAPSTSAATVAVDSSSTGIATSPASPVLQGWMLMAMLGLAAKGLDAAAMWIAGYASQVLQMPEFQAYPVVAKLANLLVLLSGIWVLVRVTYRQTHSIGMRLLSVICMGALGWWLAGPCGLLDAVLQKLHPGTAPVAPEVIATAFVVAAAGGALNLLYGQLVNAALTVRRYLSICVFTVVGMASLVVLLHVGQR